jgi:hypothetical protein
MPDLARQYTAMWIISELFHLQTPPRPAMHSGVGWGCCSCVLWSLVMYSFSIVNAVASARTGAISAAAGTAAGVALLLVTFARLGLPDPGSVVTGTLVVTPGRRPLFLTPVLVRCVRRVPSPLSTKTRGRCRVVLPQWQ